MSQAGPLNELGSPTIPTQFNADVGVAIPAANQLNIFGGTDIQTVAGGNTILINFGGGALTSLTPDSGGAVSPTAGNINDIGSGSITTVGNPGTSTVTTQLTGLTNHNVLVGAGTSTITKVAPSGTASVPFVSLGAALDPAFGTTNRIGLYITGTTISSGADSDGIFVDTSFIPTANITNAAAIGLFPTFNPPVGVVISNGYGLYVAAGTQGGAGSVTTGYGLYVAAPAFGTSNFAANIGGLVITSAGTGLISTGIWNGSTVTVPYGGTGNTTFTAYAPICAGTAAQNPFQSAATGIGTAGFVLTSTGAASVPTWQNVSAAGGVTSITGNTGGPEVPLLGNFNILGTGSITVAGSANTETVQLTGLTNHNVLVGAGTATITNVSPSATAGIPLVSNGAAADPSFTTAVVAGGGTGNTTFTAFSVITAGTTATNPFQNVSGLGSAGQILTSSGAGALPVWASGSGVFLSITTVNNAASPYTVLAADQFLAVDVTGGVVTLRLPNAPTAGRVIYIKDSKGNAFTNNITVTTVGGAVTIDGATSYVLNVNYQSIEVIFDGTSYEVF